MKFIVDELPYYGEDCPFYEMCQHSDAEECPRYWDKYKICSDDNPHECNLLVESSELTQKVVNEHNSEVEERKIKHLTTFGKN